MLSDKHDKRRFIDEMLDDIHRFTGYGHFGDTPGGAQFTDEKYTAVCYKEKP